MQLDRGERVDKVEQTVRELDGAYERLLRNMAHIEAEASFLVSPRLKLPT